MSETVPCKFCDGTGRVPVGPCPEIVHGRLCKGKVIPDPAYFERYPERAHLALYCGMHRNARLRGMMCEGHAHG